ncbi:MAG: hypothetical protein CMA68_03790 [Euryarchaeota archaeon]|jgi:uncharacterized membrane protein|nr:hypothetical protein [Euryarchaeota archaeon]|tara:strand:+ start:6974 stop:7387 length:414 start_codon:yes stop_codon:yes gene_type:complete
MDLRGVLSTAGGAFFIYVGIMHFTDTSWFEPIVPPVLGSATFWVLASGVVEVLVGIGLIIPRTREISGYASATLLVLLYPANLYMWVFDVELGDGASLSPTGHVVRLMLQIGGIILSLWIAGYLPREVDSFYDEEFS